MKYNNKWKLKMLNRKNYRNKIYHKINQKKFNCNTYTKNNKHLRFQKKQMKLKNLYNKIYNNKQQKNRFKQFKNR